MPDNDSVSQTESYDSHDVTAAFHECYLFGALFKLKHWVLKYIYVK